MQSIIQFFWGGEGRCEKKKNTEESKTRRYMSNINNGYSLDCEITSDHFFLTIHMLF